MKKHRIFNKSDIVYCLLTSHNRPNTIIPMKGLIIDSKWDPVNPIYQVKILKLYDNINYLKKYFIGANFYRNFEDYRPKPFLIPKEENINTLSHLMEWIANKERECYLVVDSVMCTKTLVKLKERFADIEFYMISKMYKDMREKVSRSFYKGPFSVDSKKEFDIKLKRTWKREFEKADVDIDKYIATLS